MADTTEFIDRISAKVEAKADKRIPRWALIVGISALSSIVIGSLGTVDYMRMQSIEDRFEATLAHCDQKFESMLTSANSRFASAESRLNEGERVRIERTKQLDDHETRISLNKTRIDHIESRISESLEQVRKSIERLETKVDKLKGQP